MKGMFIGLVVVAAVVIGVGFYRGWWNLTSDSTDTKVHLNVTVDKDKIQEDKKNVLGKAQDPGHDVNDEVKNEVTVPVEKSKDEAKNAASPPTARQ